MPASPERVSSHTILVVDDEDSVRAAIAELLAQAGYVVLQAANGSAACELAARQAAPVDLLLCDLVMPQVGGRETAARLRRCWSDLEVVFVSGRASRDEVAAEHAELLEKPFLAEELLGSIRRALAKRQTTLRPTPGGHALA
jgi:CheY-like chemotaxis protein